MGTGAKRETWREWVPDAADQVLITRAELLAKAERLGLKLDYSTLRYWEAEGVVPSPVRTKNGLPGQYAWWIIDLVYQVRRMQDDGLALDSIRDRVRYHATFLARHLAYSATFGGPIPQVFYDSAKKFILDDHRPMDLVEPQERLVLQLLRAAPQLPAAVYAVAELYGKRVAKEIARVSLLVETSDGTAIAIPIPYPPLSNPDREMR